MKKDFFELTYILNPVLEEDKFSELVSTVNGLIESNDGEIVEVDEWGTRKLAYDIDKKGSGYYVNMYFKAPGSAIEVIERNMRLNDDILRYLTLKYDPKMLRHYDLYKKGELPQLIEQDDDDNNDDDN